MQADIGETKEQPQPLDRGSHQQELVCRESPSWCVSHMLIQGLDPFHLHNPDAGKMKTEPKGELGGKLSTPQPRRRGPRNEADRSENPQRSQDQR